MSFWSGTLESTVSSREIHCRLLSAIWKLTYVLIMMKRTDTYQLSFSRHLPFDSHICFDTDEENKYLPTFVQSTSTLWQPHMFWHKRREQVLANLRSVGIYPLTATYVMTQTKRTSTCQPLFSRHLPFDSHICFDTDEENKYLPTFVQSTSTLWQPHMFWQQRREQNSRVSNQNGVSLLYIMFEIHHSGREPSKYLPSFVQSTSTLWQPHMFWHRRREQVLANLCSVDSYPLTAT